MAQLLSAQGVTASEIFSSLSSVLLISKAVGDTHMTFWSAEWHIRSWLPDRQTEASQWVTESSHVSEGSLYVMWWGCVCRWNADEKRQVGAHVAIFSTSQYPKLKDAIPYNMRWDECAAMLFRGNTTIAFLPVFPKRMSSFDKSDLGMDATPRLHNSQVLAGSWQARSHLGECGPKWYWKVFLKDLNKCHIRLLVGKSQYC